MTAKHYMLMAVLLTVLITLFPRNTLSADYTAGKMIFKNNCQVCHMMKSDMDYESAYYKQFRPKDFSDSLAWIGLNEKKIDCVLKKGKGVMRPVPLTADETKALIDYMVNVLKK
ncbi:MAG TPA: c-type cytochrome [Smithella sp.]|nr:c-type cytochrome [Smithella sp.]